jgi:phosphoglycolate phosphatase
MTASVRRCCRLFLFDLDGTLIDSRADITSALNRMMARMDLPALRESRVADFVGMGVQKLVERSLREINRAEPAHDLVQKGIALFREEYGNHLVVQTRLCPYVEEALDLLSWAGLAVVSNKPEGFCRRILQVLGVDARFCAIIGEDGASPRKPDPALLFKAMDRCGAGPNDTVMVGDSAVDIEAGKAAGVFTCGVLGGFRPKEELETAGCDLLVENLLELANYFCPPD